MNTSERAERSGDWELVELVNYCTALAEFLQIRRVYGQGCIDLVVRY